MIATRESCSFVTARIYPSSFAAVIGHPIQHSKSPAMHNAAFATCGMDTEMIAIDARPEQFFDVVRELSALGCVGASITTPHKHAAHALCDQRMPSAVTVGAVNCLQFVDGKIIGHNTDAVGFSSGLAQAGLSTAGKHVVILGAGGAARAVAVGVADAARISIVARRPEAVTWAVEGTAGPTVHMWNAQTLEDLFRYAAFVIDCTSAAINVEADSLKLMDSLPLAVLPKHAVVCCLTYHRTALITQRAKALGLTTHDGASMLIHQGAAAFEIWTGRTAPVAVMRQALLDALR
jgi:shikimate dehydrogenase